MKRIIVCADGTWNIRDRLDARTNTRRPTNVTKVARAVLPRDHQGTSQVVYYHLGVGTGNALDQITGGALGRGMDHNIREMYRFVAYNFEPGDELYLFGFSRGAYTVRSLAGFMHFAGLVSKAEDYYVPDLYECYQHGWGPGTPKWDHLFKEPNRKGAVRVVDRRAECPPIRFIGVWDTVGALGAPGALGQLLRRFGGARFDYRFHEVRLNPLIQNAAHALAIDEQRKPFAPTLWSTQDCAGPPGTPWRGRLQQAWFAGVHSDVGGGYDDDSLANHALHWMLGEARELGLALDDAYLKPFGSRADIELHQTMSPMYRLMGPHQRPIGVVPGGEESVHPSALERLAGQVHGYAPANLVARRV
ncbi:Uncharacterized conserved protein (DUF2235) [Burkholderiales bacterium JOSHI_001]|nr:Uncharacterized conserved protein (DUF2235) [Burkholderiales bacterium JOSHI_001]